MWGFVGGAALLIGALVAIRFTLPTRTIALVMAFGAGVLISAVAFELTIEAYTTGGLRSTAIGLALGALTFYAGDRIIDSRGGNHRKRSDGRQDQSDTAGTAIVLGALLDGIPESAVIGMGLLSGGGVATSVVVAVFISNLPESLSATVGLRKSGRSNRYIISLWAAVALASTVAAALGYVLLGDAPDNRIALIQAFAGGAILTMLADTMMPEAFESAGAETGLLTVLGFAMSAWLTALG